MRTAPVKTLAELSSVKPNALPSARPQRF